MGLELNWQQAEAADMCIDWWFKKDRKQVFEIVGPGGSGKTTIIKSIIERLGLKREEVLFMAFVGKATQALAMKGNLAKTIHASIYDMANIPKRNPRGEMIVDNGHIKMRKGFVKKNSFGPDIKLVVLDEAGMVDPNMARDILSFGAPVIALGDLDQLPPIFGNAFFLKYPDYKLTLVMRQKEDSPIIWLADLCRKGEELPLGTYGKNNEVRVIRKEDITDDDMREADMILCGRNRTKDYINEYMRKTIHKYPDYLPINIGEKIVCKQNNWGRSLDENLFLINGMVGYVEDVYLSSYNGKSIEIDFRPDFEPERVFRKVPVDLEFLKKKSNDKSGSMFSRYTKFHYGNAITIHMSQGSQYHNVLYYVEDYGSRDFIRRARYTGVTRAEEILTIAI